MNSGYIDGPWTWQFYVHRETWDNYPEVRAAELAGFEHDVRAATAERGWLLDGAPTITHRETLAVSHLDWRTETQCRDAGLDPAGLPPGPVVVWLRWARAMRRVNGVSLESV